MAIAEKLTYLNGTKTALREAINRAGGDLTVDDTFRSYAEGWLRDQSATLSLDFANQQYVAKDLTTKFPDRVGFSNIITFTRASAGTYFDATGVLQVAAVNQPRFDHDPVTGAPLGILIEEQRTNLLTRSSDFANAAWPLTAIGLGDKVVAPDGSLSATKLVPTSGAGNHFMTRGFTAADNTTVTLSFFVKRGEYRYFVLQGKTKDNQYPAASFDLDSGIARPGSTAGSATSGMELTQEGFYRCWLTWNVLSGASGLQFFITCRGDSSAASVNFTGDGTSGIYIWCTQLEAGAFPTSYIPTEASQVTRATDVASVNTLSPWYNPASGTFVIDHDVPAGRPVLSSEANIIATSQGPGRLVVAYDAIASYVSHNGSPYITGPALVFSSSIDILRSPSAYANARGQRVAYYPRVLSVGDA